MLATCFDEQLLSEAYFHLRTAFPIDDCFHDHDGAVVAMIVDNGADNHGDDDDSAQHILLVVVVVVVAVAPAAAVLVVAV